MKKLALMAVLGSLVLATGCGNNNDNDDKMDTSDKNGKTMQRQTPAKPQDENNQDYWKNGNGQGAMDKNDDQSMQQKYRSNTKQKRYNNNGYNH